MRHTLTVHGISCVRMLPTYICTYATNIHTYICYQHTYVRMLPTYIRTYATNIRTYVCYQHTYVRMLPTYIHTYATNIHTYVRMDSRYRPSDANTDLKISHITDSHHATLAQLRTHTHPPTSHIIIKQYPYTQREPVSHTHAQYQ